MELLKVYNYAVTIIVALQKRQKWKRPRDQPSVKHQFEWSRSRLKKDHCECFVKALANFGVQWDCNACLWQSNQLHWNCFESAEPERRIGARKGHELELPTLVQLQNLLWCGPMSLAKPIGIRTSLFPFHSFYACYLLKSLQKDSRRPWVFATAWSKRILSYDFGPLEHI